MKRVVLLAGRVADSEACSTGGQGKSLDSHGEEAAVSLSLGCAVDQRSRSCLSCMVVLASS